MKKLTIEQVRELKRGDIIYLKQNNISNEKLKSDWSTVGFFSTIKTNTLVLKFKGYHETFDLKYYDAYLLATKEERNNL